MLFSTNDYPLEAIQHRWEGRVIADVTVDVTGHVSACRIAQSSGFPVLDARTCEVMMARARFVPAKDSNGNPVEDVLRTPPVVWLLPR